MRTDTERAWLRLHLARGFGYATTSAALEAAGSVDALVGASAAWFRARFGPVRGPALHRGLARAPVRRTLDACRRQGNRILTPDSAGWPGTRLEPPYAPPPVLFVAGTLPTPGTPIVAIVGTRGATRYGLDFAGRLAHDLAARGVWIASGFAVGIDAAAHEGALEAPDGRTLAVLGTGLDVVYPAANAHLRDEVRARGALVSEYPPGTPGGRHTFPQRNRLIAGLANAVVVVEAPFRSGALITARHSIGHRPVLAVPGHVRRSQQAGCHALIRAGAALCRDAGDVLEELGLPRTGHAGDPAPRQEALSGPPRTLFEELDLEEAVDMDTLCRRTRLSPGEVSLALTTLELEGFATRIPGVGYVRR